MRSELMGGYRFRTRNRTIIGLCIGVLAVLVFLPTHGQRPSMAGAQDSEDDPIVPLVPPKDPPKRRAAVTFTYEKRWKSDIDQTVAEGKKLSRAAIRFHESNLWRVAGRVSVPITDEQSFDLQPYTTRGEGGKLRTDMTHTYVSVDHADPGATGGWRALISGQEDYWYTDMYDKWVHGGFRTFEGSAANKPSPKDTRNRVSCYVRTEDLTGQFSFEVVQNCPSHDIDYRFDGTSPHASDLSWCISCRFPSPDQKDWNRQVKRAGNNITAHADRTYRCSSIAGRDAQIWTEVLDVTLTIDPGSEYGFLLTPPENYAKWLPQGGASETQRGNRVKMTGRFYCKNGQPNYDREFPLQVRLASSTQKGVCMNYPAVGKLTADLRISKEGSSRKFEITSGDGGGNDKAWSMATGKFKVGEPIDVVVDCYDYGAWGNIQFTSEVPMQVMGFDDRDTLDLPLDDDHDHIADCWQQQYAKGGALNPKADADGEPKGNGVAGDGLSAYEEYRGFRCKGVHVRTDPGKKDLFIYDRDGLGYGMFEKSGIVPHLVDKDEFALEKGHPNERVINHNRGYSALGPQHLLEVNDKPMPDAYGRTWWRGTPPIPRNVTIVEIDSASCKADSPTHLAETLAHELGHACRLVHHGKRDYYATDLQYLGADNVWHPDPNGAGLSAFRVAAPHGEHSGQEECLMRYDSAVIYECKIGRYAWTKSPGDTACTQGEPYPTGTHQRTGFCSDLKGTGMNDPKHAGGPVAGNADVGNCVSEFQVNDNPPGE